MAAAASAAGAGSARDDEDERDDTTKVSAPSAAVEFFRKLMNDPVTADLEIEVESGHKFYAHRAILAARSDELRDLLSGTVSEPRAKLSFPKDSHRCWSQMLRFAYTNEWDYDASNVVQLRRLAEDRGFADFEEVVATAISKVFLKSASRALDVAVGAAAEGDDGMVEAAFAACYRNPRIALFSKTFLGLDSEAVFTFADDDRATSNEAIIFRGLMRWAEHTLLRAGSFAYRSGVTSGTSVEQNWKDWLRADHDVDSPAKLPLTFTGEAIRATLGDSITAIRFPRMDGRMLAEEVLPAGVLTDDELADSLAYAVTPEEDRPADDSIGGFSTAKRTPIEKELRIIMWGGGGASGKYGNSGCGGAGGYVRVKYSLQPGETLTVSVGEGGYADKSSSTRTTQAWPNSGLGGYNWKSGSGGGATFFLSSKRGTEVVAGAGGGGGGSAGQSWSSGGAGGGGTKDGKVGSGGDAITSGGTSDSTGRDGNGEGGKGDSGGTKTDGKHANGAGGKSGSGGTKANGGGGGAASCKHAKIEEQIDAKSYKAIKCPITGKSHGEGANDGSGKGGECKRGSHGHVTIIDTSTGKVIELEHRRSTHTFAFA